MMFSSPSKNTCEGHVHEPSRTIFIETEPRAGAAQRTEHGEDPPFDPRGGSRPSKKLRVKHEQAYAIQMYLIV